MLRILFRWSFGFGSVSAIFRGANICLLAEPTRVAGLEQWRKHGTKNILNFYSHVTWTYSLQCLFVHNILCLPIWCQNKEVVATSDPRCGHIQLAMTEAVLLQLQSSHLETLSLSCISLLYQTTSHDVHVTKKIFFGIQYFILERLCNMRPQSSGVALYPGLLIWAFCWGVASGANYLVQYSWFIFWATILQMLLATFQLGTTGIRKIHVHSHWIFLSHILRKLFVE